MTRALRIFVIDDDPLIREVLRDILEPAWDIETFDSVEACVPRLEEEKPGLFLLDIGLPGMDGYSFCRLIKDDESLRHIPVTFVSSHDTIEARLQGYDAGGEDFIVKPFAPEEVLRKVKVAQQIVLGKTRLEEQAKSAASISMRMMTSMDEIGFVVQFLRKLFGCHSELEVAAGLVELLGNYRLEGVAQTRIAQRTLTLSALGANLPLEVSVLNHVRSQGRVFEFRNRGAYNYEHVTLMINNLPLHDAELCGRLRDHLSLAALGADSRLKAIEDEEARRRLEAGIAEASRSIHEALAPPDRTHADHRAASAKLLMEFEHKLATSFANLGLTGSQERDLEEMASDFMKRLVALLDRGEETQTAMLKLGEKLGQLSK